MAETYSTVAVSGCEHRYSDYSNVFFFDIVQHAEYFEIYFCVCRQCRHGNHLAPPIHLSTLTSICLRFLLLHVYLVCPVAEKLRITRASVLIHCSDGWDRTAQICLLTELILDPYYRTLQGFCLLIEKEFCTFGYKFQDRCGHAEVWRVSVMVTILLSME